MAELGTGWEWECCCTQCWMEGCRESHHLAEKGF